MNKDAVVEYFRDLPQLTTSRLILRRLKKTDYHDMYEYASDPEVTRYLTWEPHPDLLYTLRYLSYITTRYRTGDFSDWAVIWKQTGQMIGTCGFTSFCYAHNGAEIGYVLHRSFWGQGIAPEAVRAVLRAGFLDLNIHRIEAHFMEGNDRSRRVMEKVGMTFEGMQRESMFIKNGYRTVGVCAILAPEYIRLSTR
jgi:ribosomal-protein-alanine N-acetyltransferase